MVPTILKELISPVTDLLDKIIPDKDKKREIGLEIEKLADKADQRIHEQLIAQTEINKVEAAHKSVFVAGWRPFIGWTSGVGLAYTFVVAPFTSQIAKWAGYSGEMVVLETNTLMTLVLAMLGVGGMRSFDKMRGTDTKRVGLVKDNG